MYPAFGQNDAIPLDPREWTGFDFDSPPVGVLIPLPDIFPGVTYPVSPYSIGVTVEEPAEAQAGIPWYVWLLLAFVAYKTLEKK